MKTNNSMPGEIVASIASTSEQQMTPCGDGHMVWHVWGTGEPVVFLHGGMGSWMHWVKNIPELRPKFALLIPDMPGHMDSAMPPAPYTPESIAAILVEGIERIIGSSSAYSIVGFSFGAAIGGHVARLGKDRAKALVLVSSGGLGLPRGQMKEMQRWRHLSTDAERLAAHRRNLQIGMISNPSHIDDLAVFVHSESAMRAKFPAAPISFGDTLQGCLPQVKGRLAGIWGAHDPASAPYMAERREFFHRIQPTAPLVVIEDASHWVQYEAAEQFNQALMNLESMTSRSSNSAECRNRQVKGYFGDAPCNSL